MEISVRESSGVKIFALRGKLAFGVGEAELRDAVRDALSAGSVRILLDFGEVSKIDSSGVGTLVAALLSIKRQGGVLKLLNLRPAVEDVLRITDIYDVFEVFDAESRAIDSFN